MHKKYTPLHVHSDCSLLDGLSKTKDIAKRIVEIESDGCCLSDHGSVSNSISFIQEMEKVEKKPILGIELYICDQHASIKTPDNRKLLHLVILAKNDIGWRQILQIVTESNKAEHYYYKPRISLEQLSHFLDGNIIGFSGHLGSNISDTIERFGAESAKKTAIYLESIFGKGNFFLEVQLMDREHNPAQIGLTDTVRAISKETGIPVIATPDAHYCKSSDAPLQRILLCSNMRVNMKQAMAPDFPLRGFFISDRFHIPTYDEMISYGHTEEELENTNKILDSIEKYNILSSPKLPSFPCPNNLTEDEYLTQLCRNGWKELIAGKIAEDKIPEYIDRVKYELDVIKRNNLAGYFLIVWDIINYCKKQGWLTGGGRGSSAGCIVSYLVGITKVDSVKYGLIFDRFFNEGRAGSLPDIDSDFEVEHRDEVIEYIKSKYGVERVTQIITFGNLKGKKAIGEVLRAYDEMPFEEIKRITNNIIEEHRITDELQAMEEEEEGSASILRWCLENRPDQFREWCSIGENGLEGPYAARFEQATHLEGIKANVSRHAAGVVVSRDNLDLVCPMVLDPKTEKAIGGLTMNHMEAIGLCKMDILGLNFLDKMAMIARLNTNFNPDFNALDFEDNKVWDMFASGKTKGCFQLESRLGQSMSKKLKPASLEHLSALMAVLRPGSAESLLEDGKSITDHYIMRKNGEEPVSYIHESTEPILKDTYGLLIYQEGAMKLAQKLAGFDLKQADALRKSVGKKDPKLMAKVKIEFLDGIEKANVVNKEIGEQIFGWIEKSQRYSFNACLSPDTIVETSNGYITLAECKIGDVVMTPTGQANVVKIYNQGVQDVVEVTTQSGKKIECTLGHKFLCENGEILPLHTIISNNIKIICQNDTQNETQIEDITKTKNVGQKSTLDIEIDNENHIFWANGIATSNSHSYSYAIQSFLSAYAKTYFPLEFYTAYLYYAKEKPKPQKEIYELINDAKSFDIFVQPPNIFKLNSHFDLINGQIYFGLSDIKHVGEAVVDKLRGLIKSGLTWYEFLINIADSINSQAVVALINSGACNDFNMPRIKMIFEYTIWNELSDNKEKKWIKNNIILNEKTTLLGILEAMVTVSPGKAGACANKNRHRKMLELIESIKNPPYDLVDKPHQIAQLEYALLGICLTATFLDESGSKYMANCSCQEYNSGFDTRNGYISIACQIDRISTTVTKKGNNPGREMSFITASDESGICDAIVAFPDQWEDYQYLLQEGNRVLITGTRNDKTDSLVIQNVTQI